MRCFEGLDSETSVLALSILWTKNLFCTGLLKKHYVVSKRKCIEVMHTENWRQIFHKAANKIYGNEEPI